MPCSDKFFTGGTQKVACRWGRGAEDRDLHLTEQQHAIVGASPQPAANGWGRRSRARRSSKPSLGVWLRSDDGPVTLAGPPRAAAIGAPLATDPPPDTALRGLRGRTDEEPSLQRPVVTAKGRPAMAEGLT